MVTRGRRQLAASSGLAEHGYAVLEGFLDRALVGVLRGAVRNALEAPPVAGCERPHNRLVPLRWNDPAVDLVLAGAERRRAVAGVTGGDDMRWISGYVSTKEPHTPALWWHQDWWCWDHPVALRPAPAQVLLLCYLTDTDSRNGALRLLPGSHRASSSLHAALPAAHAKGARLPPAHVALSDQPGQVTLSASAGDAVVIDYRLLHSTHPNSSSQRRDCLLLSFTPSWCTLDTDIRAHLIQHLAQPTRDEHPPRRSWHAELLPTFDDVRADLALSRDAPARFAVQTAAT